MNFNKNPFQCISFENPPDFNSYIVQKISAVVADTTDKAIVEAIIEASKNDGIDNLYLMDKTFIRNALEKQIPKKLKETEAYPHRLYCPECYFTLAFNKDNADFIKSNQTYNFCPACGQALDWSDTE